MGNCSDGSCSTGHGKSGCCSTKKCGSAEWGSCDGSDMMLELADKAWNCLMMDKMKQHWEKHRGEAMDKMAHAAVNASMAYWMNKMDGMKQAGEHRQKLMQSWG